MEKRRLVIAFVVVVALLCSVSFAGGPLGPPANLLKPGELAIDGAYFYEEMDLWGCGTWVERSRSYGEGGWGSWSSPSASLDRLKLRDFQTNAWLGSVEYGLCDNWGVYVRAGVSDAKADVYRWGYSEKESADFGYGFAWQLGTNFNICQWDSWTFGGRLQIGAAYPDDWSDSYAISDSVICQTGKLDYFQGLAYVGALCQMNDAWQLYGGIGWQTLQGTLDYKCTTTTDTSSQEADSSSIKLKHVSAIGVFGVLWKPPIDDARVGAELIVGEAGKLGFGFTGTIPIP